MLLSYPDGDGWKKEFDKQSKDMEQTRCWQRGQIANKIDMALITHDKAWFYKLVDAKRSLKL